jgi:hypothetical protein
MSLHVVVKSAALQPFFNQDLPIELRQAFNNSALLWPTILSRAQRACEQSGGSGDFEACPLSDGTMSIAVFKDNTGARVVKQAGDITKSDLTWLYEV